MDVFTLPAIFIAWSVIGWVIDTADRTIEDRKWSPGGFSKYPICPVYGFGAVMLTLLAPHLVLLPFILRFLVAATVLTAFEYVSAVFSEWVFCRRLWDYSNSHWNLHGRIDLKHTFAWGVLGTGYVAWAYPWLASVMPN